MREAPQFVIVVLLPDRVGILRDVTKVLFEAGGNIDAIRQAVVNGFFSLTLTASLAHPVAADTVERQLAAALGADAAIVVRDFRRPPAPVLPGGLRYVAMTRGADKPGTIFAISDFFVQHGVNIDDWLVEAEGGDVIYVAQVTLPRSVDAQAVQQAFRERLAARGLQADLAHENIFRATNEIGPIDALLSPA